MLIFSIGAGKTALMAKLASEISSKLSERGIQVPVIIRFCGTSPGKWDLLCNLSM